MESKAKRVTIDLEPDLYEMLEKRAVKASCSLSELVNTAIRESLLEYDVYLAGFDERNQEPLISYSEVLQKIAVTK
jgi:metal-responsive CopG/Arc/MetJ family transcriptional regulator